MVWVIKYLTADKIFAISIGMKKVTALLCLMLTACGGGQLATPAATEAAYRAYLDTWLGYTAADLVNNFGHPQYDRVVGGKRYFVYVKTRLVPVDAQNQAARMPLVAYEKSLFGQRATGTIQKSCYTTFLLEDSTVTGWRFDGNDCTYPERSN